MDQRLRVFVTAAELGNFSRAADALYLSQPAVSQQINSLETELGVKLFSRTGRTVVLTKAGMAALAHGRDILQLYGHMERVLEDMMHEAQGELLIGASYTYGEYILPYVLSDFLRDHPRITPAITISNTQDVEIGVSSGRFDIGIVEGELRLDGMRTYAFAKDEMQVVAAPEMAPSLMTPPGELDTGDPSDRTSTHDSPVEVRTAGDDVVRWLQGQTWIVREPGSGTRDMTDRLFRDFAISPRSLMEFTSTQAIKEAVEAGLGVSFLSVWTLRKERQLRTLVPVALPGGTRVRDFILVQRAPEFETRATLLFADRLRERGLPAR
ncbi:MAG: LysR family transcriptional regulator [Firmicutes bacterium]|nr:LysR family transcriptional regulator [Bacillota bacterium]